MGRMDESVKSNQAGGSGFDPGSNYVFRIMSSPFLLVRPFLWEVNGVPAALASVEGLILLAGVLLQRKRLMMIVKSARTDSFLLFALWFISLNVILFAVGSSNFGLLVRQRVMVLPLIIMLTTSSVCRGRVSRCHSGTA
jgi:hypothetical protein